MSTPTVNIYGKQPIYHYIDNYPQKIKTLYIAKDLDKKEYSRLMRMGFEVKRIPLPAAQQMSKSANHQGFLADVESIQVHPLTMFRSYEFVLMLSGVTDMGNMGALIRSAHALGVDGVIISGIKHLNIP
jgi:23S rRNA (guanosine2251-2'-O)-methyltransferase